MSLAFICIEHSLQLQDFSCLRFNNTIHDAFHKIVLNLITNYAALKYLQVFLGIAATNLTQRESTGGSKVDIGFGNLCRCPIQGILNSVINSHLETSLCICS